MSGLNRRSVMQFLTGLVAAPAVAKAVDVLPPEPPPVTVPLRKFGRAIATSEDPPTGTYAIGDIVYSVKPTNFIGWVCVGGGDTPTWREWGPLGAVERSLNTAEWDADEEDEDDDSWDDWREG